MILTLRGKDDATFLRDITVRCRFWLPTSRKQQGTCDNGGNTDLRHSLILRGVFSLLSFVPCTQFGQIANDKVQSWDCIHHKIGKTPLNRMGTLAL
jgi:hypothetical protein